NEICLTELSFKIVAGFAVLAYVQTVIFPQSADAIDDFQQNPRPGGGEIDRDADGDNLMHDLRNISGKQPLQIDAVRLERRIGDRRGKNPRQDCPDSTDMHNGCAGKIKVPVKENAWFDVPVKIRHGLVWRRY